MPGTSDAETIVIHADHIRMVQFEGRSDPGYKTVSDHVRLMARRAVEVIEGRWDTESMVKAGMLSQYNRGHYVVTKFFYSLFQPSCRIS